MSANNALLFAGDLLIAFRNPSTGVYGAYDKLEADKFEISTPSDLQEKISKGRSTFGQSVVSVNVPKPTEFAITLSEATRDVFAMQLSGVVEALNVASATFADRTVNVAKDLWVDIGLGAIKLDGLTVKPATGTTPYVLGTDYVINERLGFIKVLSAGNISGATIKVSGSTADVTGSRIVGAQQYNHTFKAKLDGINLVNQKNMVLTAFQATVSANTAYDFLGGKLADIPLKGRLEIPDGGDRPYQLDYID